MISDDEKAKLRFELANANLQSIGRAQGLYVTALLTYICIVWGLFFVGSNEVSVHLGWVDLKVDGVWRITPFVLLVLTLAYTGTVTAATPAYAHLRAAEEELLGSVHELFKLGASHRAAFIFGWCCLGLQVAFSLRPVRRCVWRFFGAKRMSDVYN